MTLEESIAKERKRQAAAREQRDKLEKSLSDLNRQYQQQQDSFHQAEQQAAQAQVFIMCYYFVLCNCPHFIHF